MRNQPENKAFSAFHRPISSAAQSATLPPLRRLTLSRLHESLHRTVKLSEPNCQRLAWFTESDNRLHPQPVADHNT
jgi:hypothetical protein